MNRDIPEYDYVIAGGGSAGCTLAARLCEDPDLNVLLIEAGGNGQSLFARMPAGNGILIGNKNYDWGYKSAPQSGMHGGHIYYPRGLGLGGSSLLNGMIYIRGNPADYDRWSDNGVAGWSYADVLPYFKRSASASHRQGDPYHSMDGRMKLAPSRNLTPLCKAFMRACEQAGAPFNLDFNGDSQLGTGRLDAKAYDGIRQSSAQAYLSEVPDNLTILTHRRVLGVEFEGRRAVGVKLSTDRETGRAMNQTISHIRATREVHLCMGSFNSPQVLMLSGVGPAEHLQSHGIPVRVDLPGVGSRLYDHPNMPLQFDILDKNLSMARHQRIDRAIWLGMQYLFNRSGPGGGPFWSSILFHALRDINMPELEMFFTPMAVKEEGAGGGWNIQTLMNPGKSVIARGKMARPGFQIDVNLLRPKSFGSVRLSSDDPLQMPVVDSGYFTHPDDVRDLVAGVRHMREVVTQPAFQGIVGSEFSPGSAVSSDREIENAVRQLATTGHHPACTCPMGRDDDMNAVLDNQLRVRGVEGLRVIDASSMPDMISGNINAPVIMIAEKAADMILGRSPLTPLDPRSPRPPRS